MQLETREIETLFARDRVASMLGRLHATPHMWRLIALVYAYLALFALVVVLAVAHP